VENLLAAIPEATKTHHVWVCYAQPTQQIPQATYGYQSVVDNWTWYIVKNTSKTK